MMMMVALAAGAVALAVLLWPPPGGVSSAAHQAAALVDPTGDVMWSGSGSSGWSDLPGALTVSPGRGELDVDDVAGTMVLLAVALRSGCGVVEAIEAVAAVSAGRAAADLATVAAAHRWGVDDRTAWAAVDPAWVRTGDALRLASRAGVAPSALLLDGAADLREAELAALDVAAARVGVRMVLPLGLTFLPAFCLTSVAPLVIALATQVLSP